MSLYSNETPTFLKVDPSWEYPVLSRIRNIGSFLVGVYLVQLSPKDIVYDLLANDAAVQMLVSFCSALYRLRKVVFVLEGIYLET